MSVWTENITAKIHQKILSGCLKICKIWQGITFFCHARIGSRLLFNTKFMICRPIHIMNSNSWYNDFFSPRDAMHSAVLTQYSVCLSVTFRYRAHRPIGWNSSKIIAYALDDPTWAIWCTGTPHNNGKIEVGPGAYESCISYLRNGAR